MKIFRYLLTAALLAALFILVGTVSADCPDDDPRCTLLPPVSQEMGVAKSEGSLQTGSAEITNLSPLDQIVPMPPPALAESIAESLVEPNFPTFEGISLPLRQQDPSDPTCGAQALGMALDGLSGGAPSSSSLWNFLEDQGMTYDFGTGVEELAHAAQSFGYAGSVPFHNASLADLRTELEADRPVVVSLGANGENQPGHFVTLTGVSPDGNWVSYNDPTLGIVVLSTEEFMALWGAQGSSGVRVAKEPLVTSEGELNVAPWVAMAAGLMALVSTTPFVLGRKGIGGKLDPGGASGGSAGGPPYPPPAGYRWVKKFVTKYKTVWEQDGWTYENRSVPRYEKQRLQVGTTTVYDKIPKYKTVRVQDGWKTVYEREAQYKTVRYVKYYRTTTQKAKHYRYVRGRRVFAGYRTITKRTPVYGTKRIFNGYKKVSKRVPNYVEKRVPDGFKIIETEVPKYEWRDVKVGWTTEKMRVPKMVQVRKPDGVEVKWELEKITPPNPTSTTTETPRPPETITPESTPEPLPVATPSPTGTPQADDFISEYSPSGPSLDGVTSKAIRELLQLLPSIKGPSDNVRIPGLTLPLPGGLITIGTQSTLSVSTNQNPDLWFNLATGQAGARSGLPIQAVIEPTTDGYWRSGLRTPVGVYDVPGPSLNGSSENYSVSAARSALISYKPDGFWNSTIRVDVNVVDMSTSMGPMRISGQSGTYFEFKPYSLALAFAVVAVAAVIFVAQPEIGLAFFGGAGKALQGATP